MDFNSDKLPLSDVLFLVLNSCSRDKRKFFIITVLQHYLHICPLLYTVEPLIAACHLSVSYGPTAGGTNLSAIHQNGCLGKCVSSVA